MLLGELLTTTATPVYTPATPRTGQKMVLNFDVLQIDATSGQSLAIDFEHKNIEDSAWTAYSGGTWYPAGRGSPFTNKSTNSSANAETYVMENPKELVRVKLTLSGAQASARVFIFSPQAAAPF